MSVIDFTFQVYAERNPAGGSSWIGGNPMFSIDGRYAVFLTAQPIWGVRKLTIADINYNNAEGPRGSSRDVGPGKADAGALNGNHAVNARVEHPRGFDFDFFSFEPTDLLGWNEKDNVLLVDSIYRHCPFCFHVRNHSSLAIDAYKV
jgi:hypothetical protein